MTAVKYRHPMDWTSPVVAANFQAAMSEHRLTLARRVKHLREARGWSKQRLAAEAGLSEQTIKRIEKAEPLKTRPDTYDKLAYALGVPVGDLDAGRPTLADLAEQDGPLERLERKLDEILSLLDAQAATREAPRPSSEPVQQLETLARSRRAAKPKHSRPAADTGSGT